MFSEVFQCAGLKTGLFTSPYIISYTDRIKINGIDIPKPALAKMAKRVKAVTDMHCDRENFSQFEITTAIAFLYFAEENCDIVVLETGLGGLLDSTNVIKTPVLTVIGSVDFDHTAILGDTLEKISESRHYKTPLPMRFECRQRHESYPHCQRAGGEKSFSARYPRHQSAQTYKL